MNANNEENLARNRIKLLKVGEVTVWTLPGPSAFFYNSGMAIDADGAPEAYHPQDHGLDFLANAGRPGNWWALVTDNAQPNGEPIVQGSNDPAPGFYISMTALEDTTKERTNPRRYVDSQVIPYIVLPSPVMKEGGAKLGDFAFVINRKNGKLSHAIIADIGPKDKLGEGSIALAETLGIPSNPRRGGTDGGVIYVVFPRSGNRNPRPLTEIETEAPKLFEAWGGMKQIDACFPG